MRATIGHDLGANGGIAVSGASAADAGWNVRALQRRQRIPSSNGRDHLDSGRCAECPGRHAAAEGCSVIVHAVNRPDTEIGPHSYCDVDNGNRRRMRPGLHAGISRYGLQFRPDALPVLTEASPQTRHAQSAIRVEMERRLFAASKNGARVLIVRAAITSGPRRRATGSRRDSSNRKAGRRGQQSQPRGVGTSGRTSDVARTSWSARAP